MPTRFAVSIIKTGGPAQVAPIEMWVKDFEVGLQISLTDYLDALATEIGSPTFLITQTGLRAAMDKASAAVVLSMKVESVKVAA